MGHSYASVPFKFLHFLVNTLELKTIEASTSRSEQHVFNGVGNTYLYENNCGWVE